jgi:hypothetical protein
MLQPSIVEGMQLPMPNYTNKNAVFNAKLILSAGGYKTH